MANIKIDRDDIRRGTLILVNAVYGIGQDTQLQQQIPVFADLPHIKMEMEAALALQKLIAFVDHDNEITGVSGYRKKAEQIRIFEDSLLKNGREFTQTYVALPDHSEHQTGLAIDLAKKQENIDFIRPEFPSDGSFQRFRSLAALAGFVERYPAGKEHITGIGAEPWHFRYVGYPHAKIMEEQGMVLEEYMDWLRQYDFLSHPYHLIDGKQHYCIGIVRVPDQVKEMRLHVPWEGRVKLSGDNIDSVILTGISPAGRNTVSQESRRETEVHMDGVSA